MILHDRAPIAFWILCALAALGTPALMVRQLNRAPDTAEPPAAPCPRCAEGQLSIQHVGVA